MPDTPLPEDWDHLLDRFAESLDGVQQSLDKAAAWHASSMDAERSAAYPVLLNEKAATHGGLTSKATEITHWVDAIESELRVSEDLLRVLLTQTETVRQRLADWGGRAIG